MLPPYTVSFAPSNRQALEALSSTLKPTAHADDRAAFVEARQRLVARQEDSYFFVVYSAVDQESI